MARRILPGHSHRLVVQPIVDTSPLAVCVASYVIAMKTRGFSPYTVAYRSRTLATFVAWLDERGVRDPAQVGASMLADYQYSLAQHRKVDGLPLSLDSQASYLVAIKGLFRWLAQTKTIVPNPAADIDLPRTARRIPRTVLNTAEVERVLALPNIDEPVGLRDRAILEVLYSTGIRRSELCRLRIHDVDASRGIVVIELGKGRRDRIVPIGNRALHWVHRYLAHARPELMTPPDDGVLFLTVEGNDLTPDHLTERIGRYIRTATGKRGSCHTFRHTMATLMLDAGADVRYIQEILGHVDLSTTQIYTHVSIEALKAVHDRCHPAHSLPVQPRNRPTRPGINAAPAPTHERPATASSNNARTQRRPGVDFQVEVTADAPPRIARRGDDLVIVIDQHGVRAELRLVARDAHHLANTLAADLLDAVRETTAEPSDQSSP